jgi:MFS family permease
MFWIVVAEVPTGAVADYLGRKWSLVLGSVFAAFSVLLYGSIPSFWVFLLGEFMFAIAAAFTSGADDALLYDSLRELGQERESKNIFGKAHSIHLLGIMLAAPFGGFIAYKFGLNAPMLATSIPFLFSGLVALSIKEPKVIDRTSESKRYFNIIKGGFIFFYRHKKLRLVALDGAIVASAAYFVIWLYQPILTKSGLPVAYFGLVHAFLVLCEIVVASNFVRLEKLFGSPKMFLGFSAVSTVLGFAVVALFPNVYTVLLLIVLAGGFGLTRIEYLRSFMNSFIPSRERATVLSSISMLKRFVLVILNPIVGFTADRSITVALLLICLLPLAVFLFSPLERETLNPV